ncbi:hypothetical protein H5410_028512 [Solanum commersonii]|uniref:Uncharacterized protein n=1 Tax=Solanum commersonii TaxID=4109 RepID=A0A9J5Z6C7_SOLCO|nr:hypothetical protein H5410_028512 [Solanum commersonii]
MPQKTYNLLMFNSFDALLNAIEKYGNVMGQILHISNHEIVEIIQENQIVTLLKFNTLIKLIMYTSAHEVSLMDSINLIYPSIRKYKELPNSRLTLTYAYCTYGFGYDEFHDDYKGKFHWTTNTHDYNECEVGEIISFGLADENVGKVEQPYYGEGKSISELGVLGCDLCGFSHHLTIGVDV